MSQPQGRPLREVRAIVEADQRRFDQLGQLWSSLSAGEQERLIAQAREWIGSEGLEELAQEEEDS